MWNSLGGQNYIFFSLVSSVYLRQVAGQSSQAGYFAGAQGQYAPTVAGGQPRPTGMAPQPLPLGGGPDHMHGYEDEETIKLRAERSGRAGGWSVELSKKRALEEAFSSIWIY